MSNAEKMGFINHTLSELKLRIDETNNISRQLNGHKESSTSKQVFLLVISGIILSILLWALIKSEIILGILTINDIEPDSRFFYIAIIGVCIYIILHSINRILYILGIARIDIHVFNVKKIENFLKKTMNNIHNIAAEADSFIFAQANKLIKSDYDTDTELAKYTKIINTYSNPDKRVLNIVLGVIHWLSGILFVGLISIISNQYLGEKITALTGIEPMPLIPYYYITASIMIFVLLQELFANLFELSVKKRFKNTMGFLLLIGIFAIFLQTFLYSGDEYYFGITMRELQIEGESYTIPSLFSTLLMSESGNDYFRFIRAFCIPFLPLALYVLFSSIVCSICKIDKRVLNAIGFVFILGVLLVLLYLIFGLNYASFVDEVGEIFIKGMVTMMMMMFIPLMVSAFFVSLIILIGKIRNAISSWILLGYGIVYIIVSFILILSYDSSSRMGIVGQFFTMLIMLVIMIISAAIALIPGALLLLMASSRSK